MKSNVENIQSGLKAFLTGYGKRDPNVLKPLAAYPRWQAQAQAEMDRRATRLLENLPEEDLAAIAEGEVDIAALASEVLDILEE